MATTGQKFLELAGAGSIRVTRHAQKRNQEGTGLYVSEHIARQWFQQAVLTSVDDLRGLGYRPAYQRRKDQGTTSWYFRLPIASAECFAVVQQDDDGELVWVTTYSPTLQSQHLRIHNAPQTVAA